MCKLCGGQLVGLGILGDLLWCRCEDCGMQESIQVEENEETGEYDYV
jgi:hypothetical protein